ncbi:MAG: hypothetical protein LBB94_03960 [Clostridiales bacterium]|jgi:hypothetical protein|nr:hypothetical protein [Clostridiales bacterium]
MASDQLFHEDEIFEHFSGLNVKGLSMDGAKLYNNNPHTRDKLKNMFMLYNHELDKPFCAIVCYDPDYPVVLCKMYVKDLQCGIQQVPPDTEARWCDTT